MYISYVIDRLCEKYGCENELISDSGNNFDYESMEGYYTNEVVIIGEIKSENEWNDNSPIWDLYYDLKCYYESECIKEDWDFLENNGFESGCDYHRIYVYWKE